MAYDKMLNWSLFYTSIFAARKAPMVDVANPDGLVRSQAVRSGGLRVTLNGAEARHTLTGLFIEDRFGASVQHVAFATPDIFSSAAALEARGFFTPVPPCRTCGSSAGLPAVQCIGTTRQMIPAALTTDRLAISVFSASEYIVARCNDA